MHIRTRSPAKPEQTNDNAWSADEGWRKTELWADLAVGIEFRFDELVEVEKEWWSDNEDTDKNPEECHAFEAEAEAVDTTKYYGE